MSDRAKDNAELCDLLLGEYQKAKPKLSNKQKQNQYFSVLFTDIPKKYKTHSHDLSSQARISKNCPLSDTYVLLLSAMGIELSVSKVTVFGETLYYLDVYYGDFKFKDCIG